LCHCRVMTEFTKKPNEESPVETIASGGLPSAPAELTIIHIRGGFDHETADDRAVARDVEFHRGADESLTAFRARCERAAREMGASILIFGSPRQPTWSD
jgi:hypothetical protein